jgi:lysozyme
MIDAVLDLSHHNANVDFATLKASGVIGVIHKATQGATNADDRYASRRAAALNAGLLWGAYHFGTNADPTAQADHFLAVVNPGPQDLLVLDFEQNAAGQMSLAQAERFATVVNARVGRWPGLYSGNSFLNEQIVAPNATLINCWLWLARYGPSQPTPPPGWTTWTMWQYTESGSAPGVGGAVDRNRFNGDEAGLRRLWGAGD